MVTGPTHRSAAGQDSEGKMGVSMVVQAAASLLKPKLHNPFHAKGM